MEITQAIRDAVHREDCERFGHDLDYSFLSIFVTEMDKPVRLEVGSPDDAVLPHLACRRCPMAYVLLPLEGATYEDAERKLYNVLPATNQLAKEIVRKRGKREERKNGKTPKARTASAPSEEEPVGDTGSNDPESIDSTSGPAGGLGSSS